MKIYRIYIVGDVPPDLKDRIATIHAEGILKAKNGEASTGTVPSMRRSRASIYRSSVGRREQAGVKSPTV